MDPPPVLCFHPRRIFFLQYGPLKKTPLVWISEHAFDAEGEKVHVLREHILSSGGRQLATLLERRGRSSGTMVSY